VTRSTSQVVFNRSEHSYAVSGRCINSVTRIMREEGAGFNWSKDNNGANFGTVFHEVMKIQITDDRAWHEKDEYHQPYRQDDDGNDVSMYDDVEWFMEDESCREWNNAILKFIKHQEPKPLHVEHVVYSERYGYAGMLDFLGTVEKFGETIILADWKTWANPSSSLIAMSGLQTAAYEMAFREQENFKGRIKRIAVHFAPNTYKFIPLNNPADFPAFQSCLNWNRWKEQNL